MEPLDHSSRTRPVAIWLLIGVFMIMVQVLLGGITRLTGSGLSITDWDPIMGAIPPLNHAAWMEAFHRYQQTPQYRLLNTSFTLADFKFIFFWEWFHRLWARLLGVVFLIPFLVFLWQKRFTRGMVRPMIILFLLGGLQGLVGWIMVKSGLIADRVSVNHFKLTIHFIAAMILLCYTLWFALSLLIIAENRTPDRRLHRFTLWIVVLLGVQLVYGGFMAGLHAALAAHSWPDINGMAVPTGMFRLQPALSNLTDNRITVQFIHRGLAYLLAVLIVVWWRRARKAGGLLGRFSGLAPLVVLVQITLGVLTVLGSRVHIPVDMAVAHQFVGMLLLEVMFAMLFLASGPRREPVPAADISGSSAMRSGAEVPAGR
jgi:cytochrome c oxidase assembly protein subunit 15